MTQLPESIYETMIEHILAMTTEDIIKSIAHCKNDLAHKNNKTICAFMMNELEERTGIEQNF